MTDRGRTLKYSAVFLAAIILFPCPEKTLSRVNDQLIMVAAGDLMLGPWVEEVIYENGWTYPFVYLDSLLNDAQIVFANLEAPFGPGGRAFEKAYTFLVNPDMVNVLEAGKINVVSLANNHIMDYGDSVLFRTIDLLERNNIFYSGAGFNLHEARKPALLNINGLQIAIACYSLTFPKEFWATDTSAGTCFPYHTFYRNDLKKFKSKNDFLVVSFHWGGELMNTPKDYQMDLAHQAIDAGADLVIGHHPHVIQGIEVYKNKIIAYSLGNYIFGSFSENVRESMLLKFYIKNNRIKKCRIYPIYVYNKEVLFQPRFMEGVKKTEFIKDLQNLSLELNNNRNVISNTCWITL